MMPADPASPLPTHRPGHGVPHAPDDPAHRPHRRRLARAAESTVWILIAVLALWLRADHIQRRPMHVDEAVQAAKTGILFETGHYRYNPYEFHGPTLYYLTQPVLHLGGVASYAASSEWHYRIVPLIVGLSLIALLALARGVLGRVGAPAAALLTAVSPGMVFFSRFYVQEMLFVAFSLLALVALWRWRRRPSYAWAGVFGLALGLMHATKETCIIGFAAMALGGAAAWWTELRAQPEAHDDPGEPLRRRHALGHLAVAAAVAVVISVLFFTSFLTHPRGPLDSLMTYVHYFERAGGEGTAGPHRHPWHYYFGLLAWFKYAPGPWWSEGLILLLAAAGAILAIRPARRLPRQRRAALRFLAVYSVVLAIVYSLIPYKSPWTMLTFLHGLIMLAGVGAAELLRPARRRPLQAALALLLLAGIAHLTLQARRATGRYEADPRNPYVYAHSTRDVIRLGRRIEDIAAVHPAGREMFVAVVNEDYWPLPWYLRRMQRVGYWPGPEAAPDLAGAPLVVTAPRHESALAPRLDGEYLTEFYGLRPDVLLVCHIRRDLWDAFIETRTGDGP